MIIHVLLLMFANHPSVRPAWESANGGPRCFKAERGDRFPFAQPTFGGLSLNLNIEKVTFERHFMQDSQRSGARFLFAYMNH